MLSCPIWAQTEYKGFTLNVASRTYNVTVDHTRRVIGTTCGHPATWNDKTIQLFDPLLTGIHEGFVPEDFEFELIEYDDNGESIIH